MAVTAASSVSIFRPTGSYINASINTNKYPCGPKFESRCTSYPYGTANIGGRTYKTFYMRQSKMFICQMLVTGKYRRELLLQQMKIPWDYTFRLDYIKLVGNGKVLLVIMALLSIPESPLVLATTASLFMVLVKHIRTPCY